VLEYLCDFFSHFVSTKITPVIFLQINSWINSINFYIKFVVITPSESILIFVELSLILKNLLVLNNLYELGATCLQVFLLRMMCSEPVLSFTCVYFVLSAYFTSF